MARAMITQYGMSEKFGMVGLESPENQYLSGRNVLNCSDETATEIDREVVKIIKDAYAEALRLLREHRKALDEIAAFLIEKETITGKEFMDIFHEVERREEQEAEEAAEAQAEAKAEPVEDTVPDKTAEAQTEAQPEQPASEAEEEKTEPEAAAEDQSEQGEKDHTEM